MHFCLTTYNVCTTDGGHLKETGALLRHCPSDVGRRGLPFERGSVQPLTAQHTYAPRVQKCRNTSFLQNRREDTLQTERHTNNA